MRHCSPLTSKEMLQPDFSLQSNHEQTKKSSLKTYNQIEL